MFNNGKHFAGTDQERLEDFQKALDSKNIKAIWAARGGYGSVRILDQLNFSKFIKQSKMDYWLFRHHGFSQSSSSFGC